ncbi:MAG: lipid biosynthesis B12-binding/radical SAM protein [Bacteroidota bacterium]
MKTDNKTILFVSANTLTIPYPVYPTGISYLATYLTKNLPYYSVKLFDFNLSKPEEFIHLLDTFNPKYIAVSIRNIDGVNSYDPKNFIGGYEKIMQLIRNNYHANYSLFMGGAGFSIFPVTLFNELKPDYAIVGEGEKSLVDLITKLDANHDVTDVEGLVYNDGGKVVINQRKVNTTDLSLNFDDNLVDFYWLNSGMLNIQTKRGCPFRCVYCTYPVIEGRNVRTLNQDEIVETISKLKRDKGIDYIFFTDSVFNMKNEYNIELAEKLIKSKANIRWGAYFYPQGLTEEILKLFKASGLTHIEFGTESISDRTLKNYGKHFTVEDIIQQSELCRKTEIFYAHFLILAGYGENDETINETFENSKRINSTVFFPFVGMRIYPGTKLYDISLLEGIIEKDDLLLEPKYYISKQVALDTLKLRANLSGKRWVFPDEDTATVSKKMRLMRKKKGPLWEFLIK